MLTGVIVLTVAAVLVWSGRAGHESVVDRHGDREYALDALALQYLADFTDDERLIRDTASVYWCGTPVFAQLDSLTPEERSRVALRMRARAMVIRAGGVPKDAPLEGGEEPSEFGIFLMPAEGLPRAL